MKDKLVLSLPKHIAKVGFGFIIYSDGKGWLRKYTIKKSKKIVVEEESEIGHVKRYNWMWCI